MPSFLSIPKLLWFITVVSFCSALGIVIQSSMSTPSSQAHPVQAALISAQNEWQNALALQREFEQIHWLYNASASAIQAELLKRADDHWPLSRVA